MGPRHARIALAASAVAVVVSGCNGGSPTTTASGPNVVIGSGELPATVPEEFPIPQGAVIASTLVNFDAGTTEVILRAAVNGAVLVQFYSVSLPEAGFQLDDVVVEAASWDVLFTGRGVSGSIRIRNAGADISEAVLELADL